MVFVVSAAVVECTAPNFTDLLEVPFGPYWTVLYCRLAIQVLINVRVRCFWLRVGVPVNQNRRVRSLSPLTVGVDRASVEKCVAWRTCRFRPWAFGNSHESRPLFLEYDVKDVCKFLKFDGELMLCSGQSACDLFVRLCPARSQPPFEFLHRGRYDVHDVGWRERKTALPLRACVGELGCSVHRHVHDGCVPIMCHAHYL
jgi:hypothetical protein